MNVSGPLSSSSISVPRHQELDLRPFQRVTAQILTVTGSTALLTIEGYPIVAQLATADQAATLFSQQTAHFIVTQRTNQKITLKIVENDQSQPGLARSIAQGPELSARLLEQHNLPITPNNLIIARALLKKHMPVTPDLINEILEPLSAYGAWGNKEAELAVALKAAGLPVSAQSLALASQQAAQLGDSLTQLIEKLADLAGRNLPDDLLDKLDSNLLLLNAIILQGDGTTSQLAEQLQEAVKLLGKSLERTVLEQSQNPHEPLSEASLVSLARLSQMLERAGKAEVAHEIREFLSDLQRSQFLNANPDSILVQREWTEIGFVIQSAQQKLNQESCSARLRIAHESRNGSNNIDPAYTRLILQVDLKPGKTVEVDLAIVSKQIKTLVTAADPLWCLQAQEELPTLEEALRSLGFTLRETQIEVGEAKPFEQLTTSSGAYPMTVDIEV